MEASEGVETSDQNFFLQIFIDGTSLSFGTQEGKSWV